MKTQDWQEKDLEVGIASTHDSLEAMEDGHQSDPQMTERSTNAGLPPSETDEEVSQGKSQGNVMKKLERAVSTLSSSGKIEKRLERAKHPEMNLAENVVGWEGQDDPTMPLNFASRRKWLLLILTSLTTLMVALTSAMIAPGVTYISEEFGNSSNILDTIIVTIFLLGFAVGPIALSPLSEIYGRKLVLTGGNVFFLLWQIGCALAPNISSLIVFRFLAGVGGSASLTIGGGLISDLFYLDERGTASSMYAIGPLFGPVLGPICGGFIAERLGWRWVFWVLLILAALLLITLEIFSKETNHRVIMRWKVDKLRKELCNDNLRSCYDDPGAALRTPSQTLATSLTRPLKMLFFSPILFILATYMAFIYGLQYLLSTTIPLVFQTTYHWKPELTGLAYIGLGLGFFGGIMAVARINDATVVRLTKANNGVSEPEMRLPACVLFACFIPVSFFWYGWSTFYKTHWLVPIIGLIPFGLGQIGVFIPIQTYVIDSFPEFAASGIAALTIMRSLLGAVLPLAGTKMYDSLGLGWGNSLLGFVALALIPFPLLIFKFGGAVRKKYPLEL
ncbi:hypothetical protein BP6252_05984 [Coleophoma cylindrospora]|uniref:Major facilitator superfamily (MFS) profile domain-containing protein n=1 Tax=Coleophoma cylindrospora TaxID=1849047 RepID=A0A3D8RL75_9HELO|nr:hypothetical protein BP6252_05984 [Coleophoma cylindrospora]